MSDNWYTDYQQNKRLRGLEEDLSSVSASLASARSSQRRLHAELSKVRGSLEQRLDRLSAAFDAFVEISDLRVTLGLFDAQGRVRHQARQLLAGVGPDGEVSDVDAYWLAPALSALRVAVDGVADTADSWSLAQGPRRPAAPRCSTCSAPACSAAGTRCPPRCSPTCCRCRARRCRATSVPCGHSRPTASSARRAGSWCAAAGIEFVRALPDDGAGRRGRRAARASVTAGAIGGAAAARARRASPTWPPRWRPAAGLSALRTWVDEALAGYTNEPAAEVDPEVRRVLRPAGRRGQRGRAAAAGAGARAARGDRGQRAPNRPPGTVRPARRSTLLRTDAADAEHPGRRAAAVRISGELVVAAAERLAATARTDAPYRVEARTRQGVVTITPDGPDQGVARAAAVPDRRRRRTCPASAGRSRSWRSPCRWRSWCWRSWPAGAG